MQTFKDSKRLVEEKDVTNLFGQSSTFNLSGEAETSAAEEQPDRNNRVNENAAVQHAVDSSSNHFYCHS